MRNPETFEESPLVHESHLGGQVALGIARIMGRYGQIEAHWGVENVKDGYFLYINAPQTGGHFLTSSKKFAEGFMELLEPGREYRVREVSEGERYSTSGGGQYTHGIRDRHDHHR